jgi:hypothetical protein
MRYVGHQSMSMTMEVYNRLVQATTAPATNREANESLENRPNRVRSSTSYDPFLTGGIS